MFDYWEDLKYGNDAYWENGGLGVPTGEKRKRTMQKPTKQVLKRRKVTLKDTESDNVRFVPMVARTKFVRTVTSPKRRPTFALLPNWRQRFADQTGVIQPKSMPADMKRAAESKDEDITPPQTRHFDAMATDQGQGGDEGEWEDEDEEIQLDTHQTEAALASVLGDRLKGTPLEGMDRGQLLETLSGMLSGGGENAISELTNTLLGQTSEEGGEAMSGLRGWLSQQGASLPEGDEEEDDEMANDAAPSSSIHVPQASPIDSAIGSSKGGPTDLSLHDSSPSSAKKRGAASDASGSARKRKRVAFKGAENGAPTGRSFSPEVGEDETTVPAETSASNLANGTTAHELDEEESTTVATTRSVNAKAARKNRKGTASQNEPDPVDAVDEESGDAQARPIPAPPTRQTRKRKADTEPNALEPHDAAPSNKRQARKIAATRSTNEGTIGRRTRSGRSAVGK
jgi:hypothetical protein